MDRPCTRATLNRPITNNALDTSSGGASSEILVRLKGGIFFWIDFYCRFGRFEKMIPISKSQKLVRLEPHGPHSERRP